MAPAASWKTLETKLTAMERPFALQQAILACRPGGTLSLPGVFISMVPVMMGALVAKGLTVKTGQTHVQRYLGPLMKLIEDRKIDPSFLAVDAEARSKLKTRLRR